MLRQGGLKLLSIIAIRLARALFRMPNGFVVAVIGAVIGIAHIAGLTEDALSDLHDAHRAMRDGPPLSDSMRGFILKSDPVVLADFLYHVLGGEPPFEEVDPW